MSAEPKPGIYYDLSDAAYRAIHAVSQTGLKIVGQESPAAYRWKMDHPDEPSESMVLGSAVDCLALEPERWSSLFAERPDVDGRTKEGKAILAAFEPGSRRVIKRAAVEQAHAIADAVLSHPTAGPLVSTTQHQISLVWEDEDCRALCKARLDMVRCGSDGLASLIADLKTCRAGAAHLLAWPRYAYGLGMHYQAAMYVDGWAALTGETLPWLWCAVETEPPYHVGVYQADPGWIWTGRDAYRAALECYAWCRETDHWPGYSTEVKMVALPVWAARATEEVEA